MFERYIEESRRAVFYARYEATCHRAAAISPAHLLMGLAREAGSRTEAIASLKKNEASLRELLGVPLPPGKPVGIDFTQNIPLDLDAKMVLAYAAKEAEGDHAYWIDTDHLLRGILSFPNQASAALQTLSMDLATVRLAAQAHRAKYPESSSLFSRLFGGPLRAHRTALLKLLIALLVAAVGVLVIRWIN